MTIHADQAATAKQAPLPKALSGAWFWVWNTAPDNPAMANADGAIVRAANGGGTVGGGYDFKPNYAKWAKAYGAKRCAAWTFIYATTDGTHAADVLVGAAPEAPAYVADVEDYEGKTASAAVCEAFCKRMKQLRPGTPLGFSSYPTRAQAMQQHVPWDALLALCDFGAPQVYQPYQGLKLADGTVYADHKGKPVQVAFEPTTWAGWEPAARKARDRDGGVSIWALPLDQKYWPAVKALRGTGGGEVTTPVSADLVELDLRDAAAHPVSHRLVDNLQGLLKATRDQALDPGAIDGKASEKTLAAVRAYQKAKGLKVDGIVGANTWRALISG
jgi:hypothetical protein